MVAFSRGKLTLAQAKSEMRAQVHVARVTPPVRAQMLKAVDEFSPITPKFIVGMVGSKLKGVEWSGDHPVVKVQRNPANVALSKVLDLGQSQFGKMLNTYNIDPAVLKTTSHVALTQRRGRKTVLEFQLFGPLLKRLYSVERSW